MTSNKKKYDLIIRNGSIIDGTGRRAYKADIAITNDKIAKIGCIDEEALKEIDAKEFIINDYQNLTSNLNSLLVQTPDNKLLLLLVL